MSGFERIFSIVFENITVAAAQDLFYVKASSTNGIAVRRLSLSASGVTAAAEIRVRLKRLFGATVTAGTAGTAPTLVKAQSRMVYAALSAARANDTTQATGTSTAALANWNWNVLMDFLEVPATAEERWEAEASEALVLEVLGTPASTVLSGVFVFEEV